MRWPIRTVEQRFEEKFIPEPNSGCRLWTASTLRGYGLFRTVDSEGNKIRYAHRFSYYLKHGKLPPTLMVCHKCDTPACVNPDHLFLGTATDNQRDKWQKGRGDRNPIIARIMRDKTCCKNGHLFDEENTRHRSRGNRECRACHRLQERARKLRLTAL